MSGGARPGGWLPQLSGMLALRLLGLSLQLGFVALAAEFSDPESLADFYALLAVSTIFGSMVDFGFVRYSFRLLRRSRPALVYRAALEAVAAGCALGLPVAVAYLVLAGLPMREGLPMLAASAAFGVVALCRNLLVIRQNFAGAVALEALIGILQVTMVGAAALALSPQPLGLSVLCAVYVASVLFTGAAGITLCRGFPDWAAALAPRRSVPSGAGRAFVRRFRRALPIGVETSAYNLWLNLPILWLSLAGSSADVAVFGMYLRVIGAVRALIGVLVLRIQNMAYARPDVATARLLLRPALAAGMGGAAALALSGAFASWQGAAWATQFEAVRLLLGVPAVGVVILPVLTLYAVLTTLLTGRNLLAVAVVALLLGLAAETAVLAAATLLPSGAPALSAAVWALVVSGVIMAVHMARAVLRPASRPQRSAEQGAGLA